MPSQGVPSLIWVGCAIALVSNVIQSLGITLQRKSHIYEEALPQTLRRASYKRPLWQSGVLIYILANVFGSSVQITTLPLVVLAPLQASGLVFNAVLANVLLGEAFGLQGLIGTVLTSVGAVLIAAFGAITEPSHSLDELLRLLSQLPFVIWMVAQLILICIILMGVELYRRTTRKATGKCRQKARTIRGCGLGCVSGLISAHCLLLAKSAVELLIKTFVFHENQFDRWQSWVLVVVFVVLALVQLSYLNHALRLTPITILYPLTFCVYNITSIADGLIYFAQYGALSVLQISLVALGTAVLLLGILTMSWPRAEFEDEAATMVLSDDESYDGDVEDVTKRDLPPRAERRYSSTGSCSSSQRSLHRRTTSERTPLLPVQEEGPSNGMGRGSWYRTLQPWRRRHERT
ncbi:hypothetical protein SAICODRAFT_4415 [Saitoella complicata NRRL Y-17804]|nr:uncharacterized protein SAICODRAFT_4415 [Saitoella complicata NRRL Y-17804]ODQ56226.1 hypothetical protein SAICODRAFT_4415 [Saitoella complicata NRRL Y-17804]